MYLLKLRSPDEMNAPSNLSNVLTTYYWKNELLEAGVFPFKNYL